MDVHHKYLLDASKTSKPFMNGLEVSKEIIVTNVVYAIRSEKCQGIRNFKNINPLLHNGHNNVRIAKISIVK